MKKIPTLFERDWNGNRALVTRTPNPEAAWVFAGEGRATRKYDGTSCMVEKGRLYKRYELKPGKSSPDGFFPAQDVDPETGKQPGWVPVSAFAPDDRYHREAWDRVNGALPDGTYELVGPKAQGGIERAYATHTLVPHGQPDPTMPTDDAQIPRDYDGLVAFLTTHSMEGIVWHHPDGRMVKIKAKDFGIAWPRQEG